MSEQKRCCICGITLPNKYAIAGKCAEQDCEALFCSLHWHRGNHKCGKHGWEPKDLPSFTQNKGNAKMNEPKNETQICNDAEQNLTKEEKANIFKSFATFATNLGKSTGDFFSKIKNANSPQTIIGELNENLTQLQAKREPIITRSEELYNKIVAKKKVYTSAPLAKKRMLELELKSLISEYKSLEQQLNIIVEKEHTISVMRGKYFELLANKVGTKRLNEKAIDKLTDDIEDAADEADNIQDALSDLEKAGARKTKDTDSDSFAADLASFEEFDTNQAQQTEIETDITHPKQESKNVNSEETIGDI